MARLFDDAATDGLYVNSTPVTAPPFTFACWFNSDVDSADQSLIGITDSADGNDWHYLRLSNEAEIEVDSRRQAARDQAVTSTNFGTNAWHHACGVWTTTSLRDVYLDGGGKGSNATEVIPVSIDRISLGFYGDDTPSEYLSGMVAEAGLWNVALTAAEIAVLAAGYSPLVVRPQNLVGYWPLIRGLNDRVGGYNLTASGTAVVAHPPVIYPAAPMIVSVPVAIGAIAPTGVFYGSLVGPFGGPI